METICCNPSSEPSHRGGSDERSQDMVLCRISKNYHLLSPNTPILSSGRQVKMDMLFFHHNLVLPYMTYLCQSSRKDGGIGDNSKKNFLISQQKHML